MLADPTRFAAEIAGILARDAAQPPPTDCVLLVGSSTFTIWQDAPKALAPLPIVNHGFGGSTIPEVLHYMDEMVLRWQPKTLVFYCGDNDLASGRTVAEVVADFRQFMTRLRARHPQTRVIYLAIKPSPSRWQLYPTAQQANAAIAKEAAGGAEFLDLGPLLFGAAGTPRPELYLEDRLHLNATGYALWTPALRRALGVG
jgi:lysophospholipase L1-like esterase